MPIYHLNFNIFGQIQTKKNIRISKLKIDMSGDLQQRDFAVYKLQNV